MVLEVSIVGMSSCCCSSPFGSSYCYKKAYNDSSVLLLCEALRQNTVLTNLDLQGNNITDVGVPGPVHFKPEVGAVTQNSPPPPKHRLLRLRFRCKTFYGARAGIQVIWNGAHMSVHSAPIWSGHTVQRCEGQSE